MATGLGDARVSAEPADAAPGPVARLTADELRREIDLTRKDLGQTVAALAFKVNIKARARDRLQRWRAYAASDPVYAVGLAVVAAATVVAVGLALAQGRRRP